jgi:mono/diheme cytochrome c family protein
MTLKFPLMQSVVPQQLLIASMLLTGMLLLPRSAVAAVSTEQADFFEQHIRPLFAEYCVSCHGPEKQESGLRLDDREAMLRGGESGVAVVPGRASKSRLIEAVRYQNDELQMPPDDPLPDEAIANLTRWVEMGAPWSESSARQALETPLERIDEIRASHWALQPIFKPELPEVQGEHWIQNGIDHFVLARLEAEGLRPSPRAADSTLLRRAYFDLIGLPPAYETLSKHPAGDAMESLIEDLLEMPEYGQRWARHWLDVARYADTKGYIGVGEREERYAYAWTYRDYVVRALNEDVPFDDFIRHQLAADLLDLPEQEQWKLGAMGFLTLGNRFIHKRHRIIGDQIDVTMRGFMGITLMCARCHDHKFDPISMDDYYGLYGIFDSSIEPAYDQKPLLAAAPAAKSDQYVKFRKMFAERIQKYHNRRRELRDKIMREMRSFVGDYLEYVVHETMPEHRTKTDLNYKTARVLLRRHNLVADGGVVLWTRYLDKHPTGPVFGLWHQLAELSSENFAEQAAEVIAESEGVNGRLRAALEAKQPKSMIDVAHAYGAVLEKVHTDWQAIEEVDPGDTRFENAEDEELRQILYGADSPAVVRNDEQAYNLYHIKEENDLRALDQQAQNTIVQFIDSVPPRAMTLTDREEARDAPIHIRGDWRRKGHSVARQFLRMLSGDEFLAVDAGTPYREGSGRRQLAEAIASPHNPLTARVIVNRVWQWHFGQGLVPTPSDFGTRAPSPSHPELLDWLARYFIDHDWSLKSLHRLIMNSASYQQASLDVPERRAIDPENRYYWRMNRRRLEFEAMRDALLAVTGELDTRLHGLPSEDFDSPRRSLYLLVNRQQMSGVLATFDVSVPDATLPVRNKTTVPQQALYLMNNRFIADRAARLIEQLAEQLPVGKKLSEVEFAHRIERLYEVIYGRRPTVQELDLAQDFLSSPPLDAPLNIKLDEKQRAWQYGYGAYQPQQKQVQFTPFDHFDGRRWRKRAPPSEGEFGYLDARGGRPGPGPATAVIRRFTAPIAGLFLFKGVFQPQPLGGMGDGMEIRVISSRQGQLGHYKAGEEKEKIRIEKIEVEKGDTIDFIVSCREDNRFDEYGWPIEVWKVEVASDGGLNGLDVWPTEPLFDSSVAHWIGPQSPWEQYAHALLISNEFMFVD